MSTTPFFGLWGRVLVCLFCLVLRGLTLEAAEAAIAAEPEEGQSWLGQEFVRIRRSGESGMEIEEYLPRGERLEDWRQRITVRHVAPGTGFDPELFVRRLKQELGAVPGALVEDCVAAPGGRVLSVTQAGASPTERVRSCLLVLYSAEVGLVLLQYSQHVERLEEAVAEIQLTAWRERLLSQARGSGSVASVAPSQGGAGVQHVERHE
jgi:hypothetical protein